MRRVVDVLGSAALLVLFAPVFVLAGLAIWLTDRGSVFYWQTRAGLGNRQFELLKFRSMRVNDLPLDDASEDSEVRGEHPLVTPVGRWLRRFKVDELPQLVNVLRGDMALVGPRPTVPEQTERYSPFELRRLEVPPGMTGWAQINGGIEIAWPERIMMDVWYVDHRSIFLDLKILWRTAAVVLYGERTNQEALSEAIAYANQGEVAAEAAGCQQG